MPIWRFTVALLTAGLISFAATPISHADTQDFTFDSFTADYFLSRSEQKTPVMAVEEELVARFPDFDQNHGILRAIPARYKDHTLSLEILSVSDESGQAYNYSKDEQNDNQVLKIGDADKYVHGVKTYKIKYEMRNFINYQPNGDEFFWDINGDQWPQPFGKVVARVHIPQALVAELQDRQVCYIGIYGSQNTNCSINKVEKDGGYEVTAEASSLRPNETLTIALAFDKGTFVQGPEIAREQLMQKIELAIFFAGLALPPAIAFWLMFSRWRRFGDDPKGRGIIVPQYEPPKSMNVLDCDFITKQLLRNEAVSALLIDLAVKRYITIYEIPKKGLFGSKDYELELNKMPDSLSSEESVVLKTVFDDEITSGKRVKLSDFKKSSTKKVEFYNRLKKVEDSLAEGLFKRGFFIKDPKKIKTAYILWALMPFFVGFGIIWLGAVLSALAVIGLGIGLILAAVIMWIFSVIMPARTQLGVETHDYLLGVKDYVKMAEADRIKYLQSPEGAEKIADPNAFNPSDGVAKVKLFEKLLPYAMLFGLEKDWAKQFKDLYTQPPDWYHGNWTAFNVGYLSSSVSDFGKASGLVFAAPSSSSGSGFGGGAGGGGGGGGGGGW